MNGSSQKKDASPELHQLFGEYWEFVLRESPTYATYLGDHRYDDKLDDYSKEGYNRRIDQYGQFLKQLKKIRKPKTNNWLNYDLFERELKIPIAGSKFHPYVLSITQQAGPHIELPQLVSYHPFKKREDFATYISRLEQFPRAFDQVIDCLKIGIEEKIVHPRIIVERIIPQLEVHLVEEPGDSEFHKPSKNIPPNIPVDDKRIIEKQLDEAILGSVIPSYTKLLAFVKEEYLSVSRKTVGISAVPRGREWYRYTIEFHTTTKLSPAVIHRIGLRELRRIQGEVKQIMQKLNFKGSFQEFVKTVREDRSQYYTSAEQILDGYRNILRKMDAKLPLLFRKLPQSKYDFREMEAFRAESAPAAYYYIAPEDRSRPAYFYVNTFRPESRPKYMMESLAYHEAVPGHHLQLALQQELTKLPKFRRNGGYTAFIEGWALYAEQLGKEVGFYQELLSDFGRLTAEAWRASRLVVDTGIHALKWSREKGIEFLKKNLATSEHDIMSEIDRYIAWPGQALAYMIGQLEIINLRKKAQKKLGRKFDLRQFHDRILSEGALPLALLEKQMATTTSHRRKS
jgi:uncharacterized protein (DUF885 family)